MRMTGEATVNAPPGAVLAALRDPALLAHVIPGCQDLAVTGPGTCRLTVTTAVASTTGTYTGQAKLTGHDPDSLTITASLAGAQGTINATLHASLTDTSNGTNLTYDAEAEATGMLAAVGRRLLTTTATRLAAQFLTALNAELEPPKPGRSPAGAAADPEPGRSPAGAAAEPEPGRHPVGAAGVSSPTAPSTRGASGNTTEPRTVPCQPAGRLGAASAPRPFATGVLTGAALALAGVILARRRTRQ